MLTSHTASSAIGCLVGVAHSVDEAIALLTSSGALRTPAGNCGISDIVESCAMGDAKRRAANNGSSIAGPSCAYCGATDVKLTKDHVPPESWFIDPKPINMLTVRACEACNSTFGRDDDEFRAYLGAMVGTGSPAARKFHQTKVLPGFQKNQRLLREFRSAKRLWLRTSPGASTFAQMSVMRLDAEFYHRVGRRLVRGLYRVETRSLISPSTPIEIGMVGKLGVIEKLFVGAAAGRSLGPAFAYRFAIAADDPQSTMWLMAFYDRHFMAGYTGALADIESEPS
jgi:hypothetical protein